MLPKKDPRLVSDIHSHPSREAFTLVELLVVISIIAILAALSLVGISAAERSARRAACLGHMRSIGTAVITYGSDNNLDFPLTENGAWDVPLSPYLGGSTTSAANPVEKCPEDTRPLDANGSFARSYSFNGNIPERTIQVSAPSQTILLAEWYSGGTTGPGGAGSNFQYGPNFNRVIYTPGACPSPPGQTGYHGTTSNFVFVDGHAESLDPKTTVSIDPSMFEVSR